MEYVSLKNAIKSLEIGNREIGGSINCGIPSLGAQHINNYGGLNLNDMKYISEEFYYKMKKGKIKKNDILIVKDGATTGKVAFVDANYKYTNSAISEHVFKITTNEYFNSRYVFWYLFSSKGKNEILKDFRGATVGGISTKFIEKVFLPAYSIQTQKKIVEVLDKAQELIDARKQQIKLLDDLIQSVFYNMFGDPVMNPKGWEKKKLIDSCEIVTGNTPSRKEKDNYGDFIEWIKSDNINTPYTFITKADEYLSEKGLKKSRYVEEGSILMTCIAGSLSCIGNIAITDRKVTFNQQINAIVPKMYSLMFLYTTLNISKEYIQNSSNNSMKGMLSKGKLQELVFICPPIELQNQFAQIVQQIENQKQLMQQSLTEMENNFNNLMQRAFKGELFS